MKMITEKLYSSKVLETRVPSEVIKVLCCDKENEKCMLRECPKCKNKVIMCEDFDSDEETSYKQWVIKKEINIKGKEVQVKRTTKENLNCTIGEMVDMFKKTIPKFMIHSANIKHQFLAINNFKTSLTDNSCLIHIDFSENYGCKYAKEAQAVHFGASRTQITMHTGVYYLNQQQISKSSLPTAFCTISKSLRHDAADIWAHLTPIIHHISNLRIPLETIYFWSDSPSNQYRNKTNFHLMATYLKKLLPEVKLADWNFAEAGHGKGAPDGIGGVLKWSADQTVQSFDKLMDVLKENCPGVLLQEITEENISQVDKFVEQLAAPGGKRERESRS